MTSHYAAEMEMSKISCAGVSTSADGTDVPPDLHLCSTTTSRCCSRLVTLPRTFCGLAEIHSRGPPVIHEVPNPNKKGGAETAMNAPLDPLIH